MAELDPRWSDKSDPITQGARRCDKVIDGLYMGGGFIPKHEIDKHGFDMAIGLAADTYEAHEWESIGDRTWAPFDDGPVDDDTVLTAKLSASQVARAVSKGKRVLVTCMGGLNRSGLVVGLALRSLGYDADAAIRLVREARGPFALSNEHFVEVIRG